MENGEIFIFHLSSFIFHFSFFILSNVVLSGAGCARVSPPCYFYNVDNLTSLM